MRQMVTRLSVATTLAFALSACAAFPTDPDRADTSPIRAPKAVVAGSPEAGSSARGSAQASANGVASTDAPDPAPSTLIEMPKGPTDLMDRVRAGFVLPYPDRQASCTSIA